MLMSLSADTIVQSFIQRLLAGIDRQHWFAVWLKVDLELAIDADVQKRIYWWCHFNELVLCGND